MNPSFEPGDRVRCTFGKKPREGTYITDRNDRVVVKLDNGYNIGVDPQFCSFLSHQEPLPPRTVRKDHHGDLPHLSIVSTGGTIASRVDYRTGAVTSQFDADDIMRAIPRLGSIARFRANQLYTILSENMTPRIWQELSRAVYHEICNGATGVMVTHGTDTMSFSASAVSFMVDTPVPVVFVGSQRSADRPSSDNTMNALCSASAAVSDLGEVAVVMHASTSDDRCAIHRATRVRKMHSSRRDAFASIGIPPIGEVDYPSLKVRLEGDAKRRRGCEPILADRLEERCGLLTFSPGLSPEILAAYEGYRGLVLSGTGLGHVSTSWIGPLASLVEGGTTVVMTTQCLHGRVCDRVYDTGRDLMRIGVIEGEDMLPETALVKLMWVLGNEDDQEKVAGLMRSDIRGEYTRRSR
ncbi:MAG: Glu-tRNA(Gln) amidotransferase subunit GatD [Methanoregulaceae archaeon]|nr:Glu-tRNA(Gln) amidotransferase subunit GatD [Methanoregulaceae archaeon]